MTTDNQKIFRTTTGFCHILPDKIAFTRDGKLENIDLNPPKEHRSLKFALVYGLLICAAIGFIIYKYIEGVLDLTSTIVAISIIVVMLYYIYKVVNYQTRTYFDRDKIISLKYKAGINSLSPSQFLISIKSENEKTLYANIILRSQNIFGKQETDDAIKIMVEEGLITDPRKKVS